MITQGANQTGSVPGIVNIGQLQTGYVYPNYNTEVIYLAPNTSSWESITIDLLGYEF